MSSPGFPPAGLLSHRAEDVARILEALQAGARAVTTFLGQEAGLFRTRLLFIDPARHYIMVAAPPTDQAGALLARPQLNFLAEFDGLHVEFSASQPELTSLAGAAAIRLRFPASVVRQQQRRMQPRIAVPGHSSLHCEADSDGFAPFDSELVDISLSGIGFLVYGVTITLESGTVLRGSRIQRPGASPLSADLEVRYTCPLVLPDGRHANRSGCVFLNPTREIAELIESFNRGAGDGHAAE